MSAGYELGTAQPQLVCDIYLHVISISIKVAQKRKKEKKKRAKKRKKDRLWGRKTLFVYHSLGEFWGTINYMLCHICVFNYLLKYILLLYYSDLV